MAKDAEGSALEREAKVDCPNTGPNPPGIPWVDEPEEPSGTSRGCPDEGRHIRVAANDTVKSNHIGLLDARGERDEVAVDVAYTLGMALALAFAPGRREVCGGSINIGGPSSAGAEQLVVNHTDATPDIEDGSIPHARRAQRIDQKPGCAFRPSAMIPLKALASVALIKKVFGIPAVMTAAHGEHRS